MPAALAAEAGGMQRKFWELHEMLYEDPRALTDETIEGYTSELDLDVKRFKRDLKSAALKKRILKEQKQASTLGAWGIRAFYINGRFLSGAQPLDVSEALIDEELAHAKSLVKKGTKRRAVYKPFVEGGKTKP